ncbi:MAG: polyribonucleotide nucleotidyltransferase, partial [Lachnospiraceae bacterium]|nr:polyribonucleotide nucleotidyltransferase [Lachnospiraceae bacterium]
MAYRTYELELAGRTLKVDIDRVGKQANGCAFMHYGDTTVLCTATASEKPRDGIDFFPLSVEYEEKMYSVGKIPGGFNKREGKASENAVLTSRVIDRPMRPLFPKDYRNDVTLDCMVMSVDPNTRPELVAMLGAAISTCISDIPFDGPCAMTQMGMVNGEFIVNPNQEQWAKGDLKLTVASTREKVIMIEAGANIIPEAKMIEAIYKCHEVNQTIIAFIDRIVAECGKKKHEYTSCAVPAELFEEIKKIVPPAEMETAVFTDAKQVREENIRNITAKLEEAFADNEEYLAVLGEAIYQYEKKTVRKMILKDHKRPDGREITQIRPLSAEVDIIPRVHGSSMFTRGQTQICDVVTLAPLSEAQKVDGLDPNVTEKRYIHHYNFPSYSVGETKPSRGPGRREITQIRPLAAEVDIIPRVHGSSMFTRGQTQICDVVTLAPLSEMQKVDGLDDNVTEKRYIHHYNFPSYSVGETKPSRGPGRREIGHGALAERAL